MIDRHTGRLPDAAVPAVHFYTSQMLLAAVCGKGLAVGGSAIALIICPAVISCVGVLPHSAVFQLNLALTAFPHIALF